MAGISKFLEVRDALSSQNWPPLAPMTLITKKSNSQKASFPFKTRPEDNIMWEPTRNHASAPWREPSSSASSLPISFCKVKMERPQNDSSFHRQQEEVPVVTLKRKSLLTAFLFIICQYAMLDTWNLLPVGIMAWCGSLTIAMELLHTAKLRHQRHQYIVRQQTKRMQERYETIIFEYRVLKQSDKKIVIIEENGRPSAIVAID